jgi:exodeoxyribonuclease VII large subunit
MTNTLQRYKNSLSIASAKLHTVSPLATLARGYAIVTTLEGNVVVDIKDLKREQDVRIQLGQGTFVSTVKEIISQ